MSIESKNIIKDRLLESLNNNIRQIAIDFNREICDKCNVDYDDLVSIWNEINSDLLLELIHKKRTVYKCEFTLGKTSKSPNKPCGEICKDDTKYGGMWLCNRHKNLFLNDHQCSFVFGERSKKSGSTCGIWVGKDILNPFHMDGTYESNNYKGMWLCRRHFNQVESYLEKKVDKPIKIGFKGKKEPDWINRHVDDSDVVIDRRSGIVCVHNKGEDSYLLIGVWDNDTNNYITPSDEAIAYAKKLGIDVEI